MRAMFRHSQIVNSISFSPDGRFLVSASDDYSVRIWNLRDGSSKELPVTASGFESFLSVVFSPDGRYIAAGDTTGLLRIWDSRTHQLVANWKGHSDYVWCVEFTPDGKWLMSGSGDTTVKCWDVSSLGIHESISGRLLGHTVRFYFHFIACSLLSHSHPQDNVRSIALFPGHSEWVVTSSDDGSVRVWDTRTGFWQLVVWGHRSSVIGVATSENFLATASIDRCVTLWRYAVL